MICIEFDANSKLGSELIKGNPNKMSSNDSILSDILSRQNLIVVNATDKCFGVITRYKETVRGTERSVLDYFVVCQELFQNIMKMVIDEQRHYVLTRFYKRKTTTTTVPSDHNIMALYLNFKWCQKIKVDRKEVYNLRNYECQQIFSENTSNHPKLLDALRNKDIFKGGAKWIKEVQHLITKSFKKIRISNTQGKKLDKKTSNLFSKRETLKKRISKTLDEEKKEEFNLMLKEVDDEISNITAEENFKTVKDNVKHLVDDSDNLNCIKMWELRKKLGVKKNEPPVGKKNSKGDLVTEHSQLKKLYEETYRKRLEHRVMKPELSSMFSMKMELFELRFEVSKNIKSEDWSEYELLQVLKRLKKNKSSDSHNLNYELFRPEIIGHDLFSSLRMLCNNVKAQLIIPDFLTFTDITSIYKLKGPKCELDSDRGIFGVSKVRSIIDKLIYHDTYETIDNAMSDSNVGGRKFKKHL